MKKFCALFCISLLFVPVAHALAGTQPLPREIERILELPEDRIDIGVAALTFAKEIYPDLDVAAYSRKIDVLADKARKLTNGTQDPEQRIRVLNTLLYQMEGFHYDHSESAARKLENHNLKGILDTKMGTCDTMPTLYLAVAQRLGYPIYPVSAPDHQFLRYVAPNFPRQNIEATSGGGYVADEAYIRDFNVNEKALKSGAYMRTMTYREYLGYLLGEIAITAYTKNGNLDRAIYSFEKVMQIYPTYPDNYISLRKAYMMKSRTTNPELAQQYREKAIKYTMKADELGYVKLPPVSK